jgi:hypothetical protein
MEFDMADVKPSVVSWIIVTLMAVSGIAVLKYAMARWPVKGLADVVNAV